MVCDQIFADTVSECSGTGPRRGRWPLAEVTAAGYQLFAADIAARCGEIRRMQGERLTVAEIAGRVGT
jgi:hypothetical protein